MRWTLCFALAVLAGGAPHTLLRGQSLQLDFAPSITDRFAEPNAKPAVAAEAPGAAIATEGRSLALTIERPFARPGDRWIEGRIVVRPESAALPGTRIMVTLLPFAGSKPVETLSLVPERERGNLSIDLRARQLSRADLLVELFEGEKRTGVARAVLSAQPFEPVAAGQKIEVKLDVPAGVGELREWPVTFGVPFAVGALWDATNLRLVDRAGRELPSQKEVTGRWSREGSIQWVRFDALVTPAGGCFVELAASAAAAATAPRLQVAEEQGKIVVDTGVARYVLARGVSPIEEISVAGRRVAAAAGTRGLYVVDQKGRLARATAEGETMQIEARGPVAASVRFDGLYRTEAGEPLARHTTRLEFSAGQPMAAVTHTLILTRDSNEVWFKEIGWELNIAPGATPAALFATDYAAPEKLVSVPLGGKVSSAYMLQDSHYFFAHGENHFSVAAQGPEGRPEVRLEGAECGSWGALIGQTGGLQMFCHDAARRHPKEFEVFGDRIVLKLFSHRAGEELDFRSPTLAKKWDLEGWTPHSKRPVRKEPAVVKAFIEEFSNIKTDAVGWAKTHQIMISPLPAREGGQVAARLGALHQNPVYALADPHWLYASKALGPLYPKDPQRFPEIEAAQDAAIDYWIDRDRRWGENGFVDYAGGPHLSGAHVGEKFYPLQFRYPKETYSLRGNLWRLWARSGRRELRDFAAASISSYMDNIQMHGPAPGGSQLAPGLFRTASELVQGLPVYWGPTGRMEISSSSNFHSYLHYYHLTGYRRARECLEEYASGIKAYWTPDTARRTSRILMLQRLLVQCYGLTWDRELRDLVDATTDLYEDTEGALLLTKERPYRSSSYKTKVDVRGLIDAWHLFGTPRFHRLARAVADHYWNYYVGSDGIGDYNDPSNVLGHFLYEDTGDPRYAQAVRISVVGNVASYDPKTRSFPPRQIEGAHLVTNIFEMDYAFDLLTRTGADRRDLTSWMSFNDGGSDTEIFVRKPENSAAVLHFRRAVRESVKSSVPVGSTYGATDTVHLGVPLGRASETGQDVSSVWQSSSGFGRAAIPKDAPAAVYSLQFGQHGTYHLIADSQLPLVLRASEPWSPAPLDEPQYPRKNRPLYLSFRYYFEVPKDSVQPQIWFEGSGRLFRPDGTPFREGTPQSGWIDLPPEQPGLWAFEGVVNKRVQVKNLPPYFAVGAPENYFRPDLTPKPPAKRSAPKEDAEPQP